MQVRILHVVGDSKFGGASFGILRLARFWRSQGWQVEILTTDGELTQQAFREGVGVLGLDVIWRDIHPWKDLKGLWRLYCHLRQNSYTLVHTHTTKAGFVGRLAAWAAGVPVIIHTSHGFAFHERSPWLKIRFYSWMDRIASLGCDRVVMVSHFHKEWGEQLGVAAKSKIVAIPNGIPDLAASDPMRMMENPNVGIRDQLGIAPGELLCLTPGRLAPEKGLEDLIEAVGHLPEVSRKRLRFAVVGDGPLRESLEEQIRQAGLQSRVHLVGFRKDIPALLRASDIVVLPTWREGLSIALLEAMAAGCPIISTRIGSNIEVAQKGRCALLAEPQNPKQMAAAIEELASREELRRSLGRAAREVYLEHYTQDRMLAGYHRMYLELLKEVENAESISSVLSSQHR